MPTNQPVQWYRETRVGGSIYSTKGDEEDISQSVTITRSEKDGLRFTVDLYNLSRGSWQGIREGDPIEIGLGYADGVFETVIVGIVETRGSPEAQGADTRYRVEGIDESEGRLRATRFHKVWDSPPIARVVRDIAAEAGLGVGRCEAPGKPFDRRYQITEKKPANRWLDRLENEAAERDPQGRQFDWSATRGKLYWGPKETAERQSAVVMKQAMPQQSGNILAGGLERADGKTDKSGDSPPSVDFEIVLDPRIEKDGLVSVENAGTRSGIYKVQSYEHESSVRDRTHKTTGTMTDVSAEFKAADNADSRRTPAGTGVI